MTGVARRLPLPPANKVKRLADEAHYLRNARWRLSSCTRLLGTGSGGRVSCGRPGALLVEEHGCLMVCCNQPVSRRSGRDGRVAAPVERSKGGGRGRVCGVRRTSQPAGTPDTASPPIREELWGRGAALGFYGPGRFRPGSFSRPGGAKASTHGPTVGPSHPEHGPGTGREHPAGEKAFRPVPGLSRVSCHSQGSRLGLLSFALRAC